MDSLITLAAVFLGWFLGQGADLVRSWLSDKKSINVLNSELEDIDAWFERMERSVKYSMQLLELQCQPCSIPSKIFFSQYLSHYSKISHKLNHEKRLLFVDIFSIIETVNELISDLKFLLSDSSSQAPLQYDSKLSAIYQNVRMARFKILNFYKKGLFPYHSFLSEAAQNFQEQIEKEIQEAKEIARTEGLEKVRAKYYGQNH